MNLKKSLFVGAAVIALGAGVGVSVTNPVQAATVRKSVKLGKKTVKKANLNKIYKNGAVLTLKRSAKSYLENDDDKTEAFTRYGKGVSFMIPSFDNDYTDGETNLISLDSMRSQSPDRFETLRGDNSYGAFKENDVTFSQPTKQEKKYLKMLKTLDYGGSVLMAKRATKLYLAPVKTGDGNKSVKSVMQKAPTKARAKTYKADHIVDLYKPTDEEFTKKAQPYLLVKFNKTWYFANQEGMVKASDVYLKDFLDFD